MKPSRGARNGRRSGVLALGFLATPLALAACGARTELAEDGMTRVAGAGAGGAGGGGGAAGHAAGTGGSVTMPALRPLSPLSTSTVTSQAPTLRWVLPDGADSASIDVCRDRACTQILTTLEVKGSSATVAVTEPLPAGTVFWRGLARKSGAPVGVMSPVWQFVVGHRSAPVDTSWGTVPDVNGDGFADVLVGAPAVQGPGRVYVYLGGPTGVASQPSITLGAGGPSIQLGSSVASAGDVNGDGYTDVIVGGYGQALGNLGAAYVYYGGPDGPASTPSLTLSGSATGDAFAYAVSSAGDVDGDGYADVLIGALQAVKGPGQAFLYRGGPGGLADTPSLTLMGLKKDDAFGAAVSSAGDMNGDGHADVVIGAYDVSLGAGAAYLYLGGPGGIPSTPSLVWGGASSDDKFGLAISPGDVNGDGLCDLLIGAFQTETGPGLAYLFAGGPTVSTVPAVTLQGPAPADLFGYAVASGGDVNGDGFSDAIVGASGLGATGAVMVYFGSAAGLASSPGATLLGKENVFGQAVAMGGDRDGDGFDDVVIGDASAAENRGAAFVFRGAAAGPSAASVVELDGLDAADRAGTAVE